MSAYRLLLPDWLADLIMIKMLIPADVYKKIKSE
jgi:hypothetical protein